MSRRPSLLLTIGMIAALLAISLRLMVPAGWMPMAQGNGVVFTLCSGVGNAGLVVGKDGVPVKAAAHDGPCAFSGLGTPALPDVPVAVAIAIYALFIALGLAATPVPRVAARSWLRPPLRGPPLRA